MDGGQSRGENVKERLETDEPVAPKSRRDFHARNRGTLVSAFPWKRRLNLIHKFPDPIVESASVRHISRRISCNTARRYGLIFSLIPPLAYYRYLFCGNVFYVNIGKYLKQNVKHTIQISVQSCTGICSKVHRTSKAHRTPENNRSNEQTPQGRYLYPPKSGAGFPPFFIFSLTFV
jgi:hypothetical protein